MSVWAVLAAAGRGERLGSDRPKAFARLGGRPLLAESLERLEESGWIDAIVIAAPPDWEEPSILVAEEIAATKVSSAVTGGESRSESVRLALDEVPEEAAVVLVHDAARPLLSEDVIERVLAPLSEGWDGVVPAVPLADTVKRVEGDRVVETLSRDDLVAVQTPQAFLADALRRAVERRRLGGDGLRLAGRVPGRPGQGGRGRPAAAEGDRRRRPGARGELARVRVGLGVDAHALVEGVPLVLGGVELDSPRGLAGHSDGDVIAHALIDAVLGAAGLGDIGSLFPSGARRVGGRLVARPALARLRAGARGRLRARERGLRAGRRGAEDRAGARGDAGEARGGDGRRGRAA